MCNLGKCCPSPSFVDRLVVVVVVLVVVVVVKIKIKGKLFLLRLGTQRRKLGIKCYEMFVRHQTTNFIMRLEDLVGVKNIQKFAQSVCA